MTTRKSMNVGQRFSIAGIEYEITAIDSEKLRYANVIGGKAQHLAWKKFEHLIESGRLQLIGASGSTEHPLPNQLSQKEAAEVNRRLAYLREIERRTNYPNSKKAATPIIKEVAAQLDDKKPPSFSTVASWYRNYLQSGRNPMSLVPKHRNKGNRNFRFDPIVEKIINRRINEDYLSRQRVTQKSVYAHTVGNILEQYAEDGLLPDDVSIPSERTINRRIEQLDVYAQVKSREGQYEAQRRLKAAGRGILATRILERVEADGNLMDVLIIDEETGEVIGRPYGTCLIDQHTRCVLAFFISMIPFSSTTLLHALKLAVSGNGERMGGAFELLVVDNGSDYISNSVRNFCSMLGICIEHGGPRDPDSKPHVERFFGTLNSQLVHLIPGTTFSNPASRGDYNSEKYACVTLAELESLVWDWIDNVYHKSVMKGHGRAPAALWEECTAHTPVATYPIENLDTIARDVIRRTISNGRVNAHYLHWYSHALANLESYLRDRGLSRQVDVYIDPLDLGKVFVRDPKDDRVLIQADCTRADYATGLSLFEHEQVVAGVKSEGKKDLASFGEYQLEIERWKIWKRLVSSGERFARKRIARLKEIEKRNKKISKIAKERVAVTKNPIQELHHMQTTQEPERQLTHHEFTEKKPTRVPAPFDEYEDSTETDSYEVEIL